MIEGGNTRHVCVDLAHNTSQSKNFDTPMFVQFPCQFTDDGFVIMPKALNFFPVLRSDGTGMTVLTLPPSRAYTSSWVISLPQKIDIRSFSSKLCAKINPTK
jgi:hypothetical protein